MNSMTLCLEYLNIYQSKDGMNQLRIKMIRRLLDLLFVATWGIVVPHVKAKN